jgi:hypothetical protein
MAAPLSNYTVVEQRPVMRFLWPGVISNWRFTTIAEGFLSKGVLLLQNNASPLSAAGTVEVIRQLKLELLPHPT